MWTIRHSRQMDNLTFSTHGQFDILNTWTIRHSRYVNNATFSTRGQFDILNMWTIWYSQHVDNSTFSIREQCNILDTWTIWHSRRIDKLFNSGELLDALSANPGGKHIWHILTARFQQFDWLMMLLAHFSCYNVAHGNRFFHIGSVVTHQKNNPPPVFSKNFVDSEAFHLPIN